MKKIINRIVLIGNGFDLAHGLPTRYEDFINWYCGKRLQELETNKTIVSSDILCVFVLERGFYLKGNIMNSWSDVYQYYKKELAGKVSDTEFFFHLVDDSELCVCKISPFFDNISRSIETKGWVDIENEYYRFLKGIAKKEPGFKCTLQELNEQHAYIQTLLIEYLGSLDKKASTIQKLKSIIYEPIKPHDVSIASLENLVGCFVTTINEQDEIYGEIEVQPDEILFIIFNYTANAERYFSKQENFDFKYIHGELRNADSIIFGYGDELDKDYYDILNLNDNEYLRNIKSVKYMESDNYRIVLSFIETDPYQVYIMGHSCGNSDRTLLNTLFEHRNCVTIKPFYHKKDDATDDYLNIVQNISRNFTDMQLMRDRVVNKTFCEPLPQVKKLS